MKCDNNGALWVGKLEVKIEWASLMSPGAKL